MRVLITGITGFVGSHLTEYVLANHPEVEVFGTKRWRSPKDNIRHLLGRISLQDCDLRDLSSMIAMFDQVRPDRVFHLAAQSFVQTSYSAPLDTLECNVIGTTNLLEAVRITRSDPVIHICSSSEVYGQVRPEEVPIREDCPLRPVSPYAVSKVGEDMIGFMYWAAYGLKTIRTRMFTHSGPRRGEVFVDSFFALQLACIEAGVQEPVLRVGNLESVRTFADVRDTVRAYWLLAAKCPPGEVYNIGGDTTMTVREMLDMLLEMSPCGKKVKVRVDPALIRPADVTLQIPCADKFKAATGWKPEIPYRQTLQDMLDYWRSEIARNRPGVDPLPGTRESDMIITRTPYRISFFGGGTDYPAWYLREGGIVLSTTIDKYCYLSCRYLPPFFNIRHRIVWSYIEAVHTISEILHPAVREGLRFLGFDDKVGVEICHQGDLPARSGIGSSSSFSVGLIKALTALKGRMIGKHDLALKAIELEQQVLKENVGSQDQVAAAYGGLNLIRFSSNGLIQVEPVTIPAGRIRELEEHLLLFYTGSSRPGGEIAGEVIAEIPRKTAHLSRMRETVEEALDILAGDRPLDDFGRLLDEFSALKRSLAASVTNADVDELYETAQGHGAVGGKLLGAGSKGFMLFFAPPERHGEIKQALRRCLWVPFRFEMEGSTAIYYTNGTST